MNLPGVFHQYRNEIDAELATVFEGFRSPFYDMLRYHLGWIDDRGQPTSQATGKALRSTLCLMACEAITGEFKPALPAAAALELVHNFSLIHDDIQDGDRERRNRPTVWVVYGKPQAINAGTAMRVLANVSMMRLGEQGLSPQKLLKALELLDESSLRLIEGQYLDLSYEKRFDISVNDYLNMVKLKTVSLIACSLEIGARLVTDDQSVIQSLITYGNDLGFAFQIRDDMLGIWGDEGKTGKPVGGDILRKKKSYPIVYAWENAEALDRYELIELYQHDGIDAERRDRILAILEKTQARAHAQNMIEGYCQHAMAEIERAPMCSGVRSAFLELIQFLNVREF